MKKHRRMIQHKFGQQKSLPLFLISFLILSIGVGYAYLVTDLAALTTY